MAKTIKAAILGANGYTGLELLRLLAAHPDVEVTHAGSRQYAGQAVGAVFPALTGFYDGLVFSDSVQPSDINADCVFCCLPHGASQDVVPALLEAGKIVIDLSADFRLRSPVVFKQWYGEHKAPALLTSAVYGLPELNRAKLKGAKLVANPGCYPTSVILGLAPLAKAGLLENDSIIADAKSGVSGAGRAASLDTAFVEVSGGFKAYKVGGHRHTPEMEQELSLLCDAKTSITFTPHLLPVSRGILSTVYAGLNKRITGAGVHKFYTDFYKNEPFVRVMQLGSLPDISQVRGSNFCDIGVYVDEVKDRLTVVSVIDNLVKGASGQAVQNMNIVCGLPEDAGLMNPPSFF
ncbi:MAG: N-acetyl-gamma-glutamyl-phosphate reductase [Deltaproteobacteria bacterium RIFCSPLOWO2_02_FULL_53_8]|nr:MAG: N-acetyl-gamma-glutamyl-phosphate reductase [Deltaproteobacteria bacterium RIFCSPLOWO2_02_FULL_53_8]